METIELPLFTQNEAKEPKKVTEEQVIAPLVEILEEATPKPPDQRPLEQVSQTVAKTLETLFPEQQRQESNIKKAKEILGGIADEFTSDQLSDVVSEIQFLTECWLDDFERKIFDGLTLQELLHERGGR